jgi:hypothetical protein
MRYSELMAPQRLAYLPQNRNLPPPGPRQPNNHVISPISAR